MADRGPGLHGSARSSVNVLYGVRYEDDPERFEQLKAEVERDTLRVGARRELYEAQNVIDPRDTRDYLPGCSKSTRCA